MRARIAAFLVVLSAVPLAAQMRENIDVRVLEIEASVLDRAGRPVQNLKREDFEVFLGRRAVPITNFFAVREGVVAAEDQTPAMRAEMTVVAPQTSIPTSLVIFVDELHLRKINQARTIAALKRYVSANLGPNTTATLIRYRGRMDVRNRPTERPGYILAELEKLEREPSTDDTLREMQQMMADIEELFWPQGKFELGEMWDVVFQQLEDYAQRRGVEVDRTIEALQSAIDLTSIFSGRKILLYVSDGLPMQPAMELFDYWDRCAQLSAVGQRETNVPIGLLHLNSGRAAAYDRSEKFRQLALNTQRADVAFFSFDAGGLRGYEGVGVENPTRHAHLDTSLFQSNLRGGLQYLAEETGGMYVANDNNIDRLLSRMSEQFRTYYSIGVKPGKGDIRVRAKNHPEWRVIATKRRPPMTKEEELEQDVRRRLYTRATENPLNATLHIGSAGRIKEQCVVPLRLSVPPPNVLTRESVSIRVVMLNAQNDESAVQRVSLAANVGAVEHSMMLRVRPEHQLVSLAITDPTSGETSFLQGEIDGSTCR